MNDNEKKLSEFFKRTIFQGLEKIDINKHEQRKSVYGAAIRSLENIHSRNTNLLQETKNKQYNLLIQLIDEIETQIVKLFENEVTNSSHTAEDNPIYETKFTPDLEGENEKGIVISFKSRFSKWIAKRGKFKRFALLGILAVLCLSIFLVLLSNMTDEKETALGLSLPYEVIADEVLLKLIRTKGSASTQLIEEDQGGILYKVGSVDEDTPSQLDIVLRGDLGKNFNATREPILITFHVEKRSTEDLQLDIIARGSGKAVRKSVNILDENTNEYFLVTNGGQPTKQRSNALIRLQISPALEKSEENPALLIKKLVFSKI